MAKVLVALAFWLSFHPLIAGGDDWEKARSIAQAQHEIVMLLIKNKQYDKVFSESKKIFALGFPVEREHLLLSHTHEVNDFLIRAGQYPLAHQILDEAMKWVRSNKSKADLHKEKAYVYRKEGKDSDAMEAFKKAVALEESGP